jgi:uncharacterized lipoprotein YddW (UPF0748 family)
MKTKSLYGFAPDLEPFAGKTPAEQVVLLRSWGNTAIFGGYQDPAFVAAAHAAGMKVYAEFGCFVHRSWWDEIPESRPVTHEGALLEPEEWYYGVNPVTPSVRQQLWDALEKLLAEHALDGVWLDFIRWPCHWESPQPYLPHTSFDEGSLTHFSRATGIEVPTADPPAAAQKLLGRYEAEWTAWRCDQITSWVAQARAILQRTRPAALLGLFGVPWRLSDHDGAILNVIGQDYRALGQHVDVFSPMVYHAMCGQPVEWIGAVTQEIQALSGKPVWPIIQSVDEPRSLPAAEYDRALGTALDNSASEGVLVFTLKGALDEAKLAATKARFRNLG